MGYVLSLPGVSTVIIGCSSPAEVDDNARIARSFQPFDEAGDASSRGAYARPRRLFYRLQTSRITTGHQTLIPLEK